MPDGGQYILIGKRADVPEEDNSACWQTIWQLLTTHDLMHMYGSEVIEDCHGEVRLPVSGGTCEHDMLASPQCVADRHRQRVRNIEPVPDSCRPAVCVNSSPLE
jgi:hypothetical protein